MKCPICNGRGNVDDPYDADGRHDTTQLLAYRANVLRGKGYSIRQIQKLLGYRSQNSVTYLLEKYPLKKRGAVK